MKILVEFDSLEEAAAFILWKDGRNEPAAQKTPIRDAGLLVRTANCCTGEGFEYLEDAQAQSDAFWLKVPNFGRKSLRDLREAKRAA